MPKKDLLRKIERSRERPTKEELLQRLQSHKPVELRKSVADAVADERESRFGSSDQ